MIKHFREMDAKKQCIGFMKSGLPILIFLMLLIVSCSTKKTFHVVKVDNPEFIPETAFIGYEDLSSPKFQALKQKYQLDTIFHGETDEMRRISLLRHWINKHIKIDNYGPYAGNGSVESILDEALQGHGYHCGHYTAVQNAILNAYGYVTRCVIADVGVPVDYIVGGGHHAINEVWSNTYHKWLVTDAKFDFQYEKNGIPLSALEIRDEFFKNKAADISSRIPAKEIPELKNITME
ncbi:MAG TPA: transglutaminase-like domain-containing protein, partial [Agriterribacter sp.]|nr:transglutaminase-like domain-containing protein [Agriterribacter sp.]